VKLVMNFCVPQRAGNFLTTAVQLLASEQGLCSVGLNTSDI
jgi:hypothetical protein